MPTNGESTADIRADSTKKARSSAGPNGRHKVSPELLELFERAQKTNHRIVIGVNGKVKDVAHHVHSLLSRFKIRPTVLWAYEKTPEIKEQKVQRAKKKKAQGTSSPLSPLESFVANTEITYLYHKDASRALGTTTDFCVLQDFPSIRANTLASVVESVAGGGVILLPLAPDPSVFTRRLYTLLSSSQNYVVVDSCLSVISMNAYCDEEMENEKNISNGQPEKEDSDAASVLIRETAHVDANRNPVNPLSVISSDATTRLLRECRTGDQIQALRKLGESMTRRCTVAVTADRGRGKSATLGLAVALGVIRGLGDIIVAAPHLSNTQTLFQFVVRGLLACGYKEHTDFTTERSRENVRSISGITVFKTHHQTVRYVFPGALSHTPALLVVDEAAAVPLPILRSMLGHHPSLLSSTTAGYEGTGKALTLKLFSVIKPESIVLEIPIRYGRNDPVEKWLNIGLSLSPAPLPLPSFPAPSSCMLFQVDKKGLFSGSKQTERVLSLISGVLLAGHYRNTPNDMQTLSDSPQHFLLPLLSPGGDILAVAQAAIEETRVSTSSPSFSSTDPGNNEIFSENPGNNGNGVSRIATEVEKQSTRPTQAYREGRKEEGNLIPWALSQYYADLSVFDLRGCRIVRIAVHPDAHSMGYGSELVSRIASELSRTSASVGNKNNTKKEDMQKPPGSLFFSPNLPPCEWLGVSFGVTDRLLGFWKKQGMLPVYLKHTPSRATGEHSLIMIKGLSARGEKYAMHTHREHTSRFMFLLSSCFRSLSSLVAVQLIPPGSSVGDSESGIPLGFADRVRLQQYSRCNLDFRVIADLLQRVALITFSQGISSTPLQQLIVLGVGLQHKTLEQTSKEAGIPGTQAQILLAKLLRSPVFSP